MQETMLFIRGEIANGKPVYELVDESGNSKGLFAVVPVQEWEAVEQLRALDPAEQKTALELPEWYDMAREFFGEIRAFSTEMYNDLSGESILNQLRYAAEREARAQFSERSAGK